MTTSSKFPINIQNSVPAVTIKNYSLESSPFVILQIVKLECICLKSVWIVRLLPTHQHRWQHIAAAAAGTGWDEIAGMGWDEIAGMATSRGSNLACEQATLTDVWTEK